MVEAHGGEVSVESEPGETVFTVSLPSRAPTADEASPSDEPADASAKL
ncbi:hypothetical protein [Leifsonia poae]